MSMSEVGKLFLPCKKPPLWIPEIDHALRFFKRELISRISHRLGPSVMEGGEEEKGQCDDRDGPSGIPRKAYGFIVSEKNEGEFVMLQSVPLFKFLINGISHRDSIIAS